MKKPYALLFVLLFITSFFYPLATIQAQGWTDITLTDGVSYTIAVSGNYRVVNDWVGSVDGGAILIAADNVVVDGQNHLLTQNSTAVGIEAIDVDTTFTNITIQNFRITSGEFGISCGTGSGNYTIINTVITNSLTSGIYIYHCDNATIRNCTVSGANSGVSAGFALSFSITNNTFSGCHNGINLFGGTPTGNITGNVIDNNVDYGIEFGNLEAQIYNNLFNNTVDVEFGPVASDFNTTMQLGTRIYSDGPYIGGNFWAKPNGSGYSQTGTDANHDGFIDTPYDVFSDGTIVDSLPYSLDYVAPAPPPATTAKPTLYFRSDTYTTLGVSNYGLDSDFTNTVQSVNSSYAGSQTVYYGFRVYLFTNATAQTELTSGQSATISSGANFTGATSGTWLCPQTSVTLGYQALKVIVYESTDNATWAAKATFISPVLITKRVQTTTWTFIINLEFYQAGGNTYSNILFDSASYKSGIAGASFLKPHESEVQWFRLASADFIGFITGGFFDIIGPAFYVFILLGIAGSLYRRYNHFGPIAFFFTLFGGVGGLAWLLVPPWAAIVVGIFVILGTTFLVWRIIR